MLFSKRQENLEFYQRPKLEFQIRPKRSVGLVSDYTAVCAKNCGNMEGLTTWK